MSPKARKEGKVKKVIPSVHPAEPEKAEIVVEEADHLYREIRIENTLQDESGRKVKLKEGADVDVVVEADPAATLPKSSKTA
jgi:predicted nucleotidyltransferase